MIIINLDACKIPRTFTGISFRILAIRQVMNSQDCGADQDQDHPHNDDSGVWPRPGTRCLDSRNPHCFYRPEARKTRIILRAVTSFVSHDNRNGGDL